MQQIEKSQTLIIRIVLLCVGIVLITLISSAFFPKLNQMNKYQGKQAKLQEQIDLTEAKEKELKEKQLRFKDDPVFVEKVAHEVGYARPEETIYQFPLDSSEGDEK